MTSSPSPPVLSQLLAFVCLAAVLGICNDRACTADSSAREALEAAGYTDIAVGGHAWFSCGKDDSFSNTFTAKNVQGADISGAVCCGVFKGCTIRY